MRIAAAQFAHGEVFDDALLRLVQTVVTGIKRLLNLCQIDLSIARALVPWQREHPIEIGAHDLILARRRREHAHPLRLAPRLLRDLFG